MGVGLAFSPGSSETAFLLVPVLQKEVTNRSQAEEVLQFVHQSPDQVLYQAGNVDSEDR